jgi:hypothetical protein
MTMKKTETNATFAIICVAILIGSYGIGFCIREINKSKNSKAETENLNQEMISNGSANDTQEIIYPQDRTNRTRQQGMTNRRNSSTGRGSRMTRAMPNFSGQDTTAAMEEFTNRGFGGMRGSRGGSGSAPGAFNIEMLTGLFNQGAFNPDALSAMGIDPGALDFETIRNFLNQDTFDPSILSAFGIDPSTVNIEALRDFFNQGTFDPSTLSSLGIDPGALDFETIINFLNQGAFDPGALGGDSGEYNQQDLDNEE